MEERLRPAGGGVAYANITFKGVAIAAPIPFGMVTSLNGHGGHHAACARWQRGKGQPQNVSVGGTQAADKQKRPAFEPNAGRLLYGLGK